MASASSHRYQSRLFSFIHKQSRVLTNRLSRVWKNLQAATGWIAPIVFYPSLPQSAAKQILQISPTVDTPIKQVLLLVEALPPEPESVNTSPSRNLLGFLWHKFFPQVNTQLSTNTNSDQSLKFADNHHPHSLAQHRAKIQGIASLISNRLLVLVSPSNEILDILNSHQQQVLQARIISEVTNWRLQRLLPSPATTKQLSVPQTWLLAPIKLFSNIVNWTQGDNQQSKLDIFPNGAIASLDRNIAKFETENLASIASKTKALQIQGLIWAAIDYFFGDRTRKLPEFTTHNLDDPWLEMSDLFGSQDVAKPSLVLEKPSTPTVSYLPENQNLTQSSQQLKQHSLRNLLNRWRQRLQTNSADLAIKTPQISKSLTKINQQKTSSQIGQNYHVSQKITARTANSPALNLSKSLFTTQSSEQLEHTPDWIETNATTMGYVKHPLEQLLAWLDLAMLWLEDVLVKFWHWLQKTS
jgi:hypothetical protein